MIEKRVGLLWAVAVALAGVVVWWLLLRETPPSAAPSEHEPPKSEVALGPTRNERSPQSRPRFNNMPGSAAAVPALPAIEGRVVTQSDEPVPGAWVYAYQADTGAVHVPADHNGSFVFPELPQGRFRVSARTAGYNEAVSDGVPQGANDVRLVMLPLSGVVGRVVDAESGLPIPEFDVICLDIVPADAAFWQEITLADSGKWEPISDPTGNFVLRGVTSGKVVAIGTRAAGFAPAFIKLGPLSSGELSSPITIALDRAAGIVIRVVDSSDRAIQGVSLHLGGDKRGPIQGTTNHAGELRLGDLAPAPLMLTATHPDFMTRTVEVLPANPPAQSEIVLAQGGRIEGSVSFGNDAVPNALVVAGALGRDGFEKTVSTDGAGEFRIAGLPPGEAEVFVDLPQGEETDAPVSRLQKRVLLEHETITRIEFRFPIETSSLEGVIRVGGQAPASATLRGTIVGDGGDSFFHTESRADGSYRVDGLLPGNAWIEVVGTTATGSDRRRNFELAIPEGALIRHDIEVRGQGMIAGTVLGLDEGETGKVMVLPAGLALDMRNARSLLMVQGLRSASVPVQPDGRFRAEGLDAGGYTLLAVVFRPDAPEETDVLSSLRATTVPVVVSANKPAHVTLDLTR